MTEKKLSEYTDEATSAHSVILLLRKWWVLAIPYYHPYAAVGNTCIKCLTHRCYYSWVREHRNRDLNLGADCVKEEGEGGSRMEWLRDVQVFDWFKIFWNRQLDFLQVPDNTKTWRTVGFFVTEACLFCLQVCPKSLAKSVSANGTAIYIFFHRWSKYDKMSCLRAQAGFEASLPIASPIL